MGKSFCRNGMEMGSRVPTMGLRAVGAGRELENSSRNATGPVNKYSSHTKQQFTATLVACRLVFFNSYC